MGREDRRSCPFAQYIHMPAGQSYAIGIQNQRRTAVFKQIQQHSFCAFVGRRDGKSFALNHQDIMTKYGTCMKMVERIPDALAGAMGNQMYVAIFPTQEEMDAFYQDVLRCI